MFFYDEKAVTADSGAIHIYQNSLKNTNHVQSPRALQSNFKVWFTKIFHSKTTGNLKQVNAQSYLDPPNQNFATIKVV